MPSVRRSHPSSRFHFWNGPICGEYPAACQHKKPANRKPDMKSAVVLVGPNDMNLNGEVAGAILRLRTARKRDPRQLLQGPSRSSRADLSQLCIVLGQNQCVPIVYSRPIRAKIAVSAFYSARNTCRARRIYDHSRQTLESDYTTCYGSTPDEPQVGNRRTANGESNESILKVYMTKQNVPNS